MIILLGAFSILRPVSNLATAVPDLINVIILLGAFTILRPVSNLATAVLSWLDCSLTAARH